MLKLEDNPPISYPETVITDHLPGRWWVAHTKARFEKAFAWDLLRNEIPYFLPMIHRVRMSGGRKRRTLLPLFTSYIFFRGEKEQRASALGTNRLCQVIEVTDQILFRSELASIQRILTGERTIDFHPYAVTGARCRIKHGPLEGIEGTVLQCNGITKLILGITLLGQGVGVEIDPDLVEEAGSRIR